MGRIDTENQLLIQGILSFKYFVVRCHSLITTLQISVLLACDLYLQVYLCLVSQPNREMSAGRLTNQKIIYEKGEISFTQYLNNCNVQQPNLKPYGIHG